MTPTMTKTQVVRTLIAAARTTPIVFTTGYASRIAHGDRRSAQPLLYDRLHGLAGPIATGLALATGRPALAVDGDGALLRNPGSLLTAGSLPDVPLVHVMIDDGAYA